MKIVINNMLENIGNMDRYKLTMAIQSAIDNYFKYEIGAVDVDVEGSENGDVNFCITPRLIAGE